MLLSDSLLQWRIGTMLEVLLQYMQNQQTMLSAVIQHEMDQELLMFSMFAHETTTKTPYRHFDHPSTWEELRERYPPDVDRWNYKFRLEEW
jgi:hypothetical protein